MRRSICHGLYIKSVVYSLAGLQHEWVYLDGFSRHNVSIGRGLDDHLEELLAQLVLHCRHQLASHVLCLAPTKEEAERNSENNIMLEAPRQPKALAPMSHSHTVTTTLLSPSTRSTKSVLRGVSKGSFNSLVELGSVCGGRGGGGGGGGGEEGGGGGGGGGGVGGETGSGG